MCESIYLCMRECGNIGSESCYDGAGDLDPMANTDEFSPWEGRVIPES